MDSKKRMMFILEEDYYFIMLKIIAILKAFGCDKKKFSDFRKLSIIYEIIKNDHNYEFVISILKVNAAEIQQYEKLTDLFCDSKISESVIKKVLFSLEKNEIVRMEKNSSGTIDVVLLESSVLKYLIDEELLNSDIAKCHELGKWIKQLWRLKLDTLQNKIFGLREVSK